MRHSLYALVLGLMLLAGPETAVHARVVRQPLSHSATSTLDSGGNDPDDSGHLILSGEMLLGGALLIACSAYVLRRSRR